MESVVTHSALNYIQVKFQPDSTSCIMTAVSQVPLHQVIWFELQLSSSRTHYCKYSHVISWLWLFIQKFLQWLLEPEQCMIVLQRITVLLLTSPTLERKMTLFAGLNKEHLNTITELKLPTIHFIFLSRILKDSTVSCIFFTSGDCISFRFFSSSLAWSRICFTSSCCWRTVSYSLEKLQVK